MAQGNHKENARFWMVMLGLFGASALYDVLVIRRMDRQQQMERWTWATVVFGVAYTLLGVAMLDRKAAILTFVAFCFSGAPMSIGDVVRYLERKTQGERMVYAVVSRHDLRHG